MKQRIKQSLASLLVVPALALATGAVVVPFAAGTASAAPFNQGIDDGANSAKSPDQPSSLTGSGGIFTTIVNILLFIIGAIAVIMIIIGGIRYTISNGDSNAITGAKNTIMYAVIGLVVAILAYAIVNFVVGGLID